MLVQIAVLAWVFLGEALSPLEIAGVVLVVAGTLAVQLGSRAPAGCRALSTGRPEPHRLTSKKGVEAGGAPADGQAGR